jgi:hypothetical protein
LRRWRLRGQFQVLKKQPVQKRQSRRGQKRPPNRVNVNDCSSWFLTYFSALHITFSVVAQELCLNRMNPNSNSVRDLDERLQECRRVLYEPAVAGTDRTELCSLHFGRPRVARKMQRIPFASMKAQRCGACSVKSKQPGLYKGHGSCVCG